MIELIKEYKDLKSKLIGEPGFENSIDEIIWNEGTLDAIDKLLENVPKDIIRLIKLNHI